MIQSAQSCLALLNNSVTTEEISRAMFLTVIASFSMICSSMVAFIMYFNK